MSVKRSKRPAQAFRTLDQEVEYWGREGSDRDVVENESVSFDVRPEARSRMISIRIPGDLLDSIRAIARARQVRYQSLIKHWLLEAVQLAAVTPATRASEGVARYAADGPAIRERALKEAAGAADWSRAA